ncbi:hypothetical protein skT53_28080 [Effusibacillus dendaii]|uniref:NAD(P)-binding domain-containing protein n=1 Tax=Effusibacillus dendaii TaxID=2743772 RepID=A0A7I8DCB2_9BACL|nr:hypothetical protein skT53_28080 [Effusibacillus dendaii]
MRILVTGGAGFIGANFIHYMFKKYRDQIKIINVDKLTYAGNLNNLREIDPELVKHGNYVFEKVDICYRQEINRVFHCTNQTLSLISQQNLTLTEVLRILTYLCTRTFWVHKCFWMPLYSMKWNDFTKYQLMKFMVLLMNQATLLRSLLSSPVHRTPLPKLRQI